MKKFIFIMLFINVFCLFSLCSFADSDLQNTLEKNNYCDCINDDCGCCTQLIVPKIIDGRLCSNFSYLPDQYGISATITYKDLTIYNETVSVKNPPHICVLHFDEIKMEICFRLYNLDIKNDCLSGCAEFEIEFFKFLKFKKLELGCFGCKNKSLWNKKIESKLDNYRSKVKSNKYEEHQQPKVILV